MKLAIISDIHENFHNLILFLKEMKQQKVEKIIFLGDFMNAGIAKVLANFDVPVISIWGNNDGDRVAITKVALGQKSNLTVGFDSYDFLKIDKRKIFITHYPLLAKPMAKSGEFDAVFYGHDHAKNVEKIGKCLLVNPGEISAHKTGHATYAVYDSASNSAEIFVLSDSVTTKTKEADEHFEKMEYHLKDSTHDY